MIRCNDCGFEFKEPVFIKEPHDEIIAVCPECKGPDLRDEVFCDCCYKWTDGIYYKTEDGKIYCENCIIRIDPDSSW